MSRNISEKARFHPTAKGARRKPPSLCGLSRSQNRNKLKIVLRSGRSLALPSIRDGRKLQARPVW